MPPPEDTPENPDDHHVAHEMAQIGRALDYRVPQDHERGFVGAGCWGRFHGAVALSVDEGLVVRALDGRLERV